MEIEGSLHALTSSRMINILIMWAACSPHSDIVLTEGRRVCQLKQFELIR